MRAFLLASAVFSIAAAGCGSGGSAIPAASVAARSLQSGGTGGGGATQVPPPPTIDGPSWYIYNGSAVTGIPASPNIDFGALQNTVRGGLSVGKTRTAQLFVYNTSKKTPLTLTIIQIAGANPADVSVDPTAVHRALTTTLPTNQSAALFLPVSFTPSAEGARSASLRLVSNAGTRSALHQRFIPQ